ncbi:MAG: FAD binding domain-containing protein [Actinomycetota bacterium]
MKPSPFEYLAPTDLAQALAALAEHGAEAKVLAGGQSLVPAMNFRLATPSVLVDLNRVGGLDDIRRDGDELVIGALVRHGDLEVTTTEDATATLLARMSRLVGHLPIRLRGTFAGSLAHADPAAEWCMLARALDATVVARSVAGERSIPAAELFEGLFTTALAVDEIITEVRLPLLGRTGTGFREKSQTAGDFATVATVATIARDDGVVADTRIGIAGAGSTPVRATRAESLLTGNEPTPDALAAAARAAAEDVDPVSDAQASSDYRRRLAEVLTRRSLEDALEAVS